MAIFSNIRQIAIGSESANVLRPTRLGVFHPGNPGPLNDVVPPVAIVEQQRVFDETESAALVALSEQWEQKSEFTIAAYKALETIEKAAAKVHAADRNYRSTVANQELARKKSDVGYQSALSKIRGEYGQIVLEVQETAQEAQRRLDAAESRATQLLKRLK